MRIILILTAVTASLVLGGCFHHREQVYAEPLPPAAPPIK